MDRVSRSTGRDPELTLVDLDAVAGGKAAKSIRWLPAEGLRSRYAFSRSDHHLVNLDGKAAISGCVFPRGGHSSLALAALILG